MVWLKNMFNKIVSYFENWKEQRKFKKRIKELQKKDPFIYKQETLWKSKTEQKKHTELLKAK